MRTEYLLDKQLEQVLGAMMHGNSLVCQVALHTGLRVGDVLRLRMEDLKPRVWITEEKTGKRRLIGIPEELRVAIIDHNRMSGGGPWCFPGRNPENHRTRQAVWKDVKRVCDFFRIRANIGTHSFRKVYAVDLMKQYGDIEKVRRALNHDNISVTLLYVMAAQMLENKQIKRPMKPSRR